MAVYLRTFTTLNGWVIFERYGDQAKRERLPKYVVHDGNGQSAGDFRRLIDAERYCRDHKPRKAVT